MTSTTTTWHRLLRAALLQAHGLDDKTIAEKRNALFREYGL